MGYKFLEHTADIKFMAWGNTLDEAFSECVKAMSEFIGKGNKIKSVKKKIISLDGDDIKNLLYHFLDEIIYLLDAESFVVAKGEVKIDGDNLRATLYGDDVRNYKGLDHIKAATYAEMFVGKRNKRWEIVAVVDV
jgi:SHS2 domain-containing protein